MINVVDNVFLITINNMFIANVIFTMNINVSIQVVTISLLKCCYHFKEVIIDQEWLQFQSLKC